MPKVHPSRTLFLRVHVGDATDPSTGRKYKLSLVNGVTPCIESETSKRMFTFGFDDVLRAAIEAGVDEPET